MNEVLKGVLVFGATFIADVCWTRYTSHVAGKRAVFAATWSAGIVFLGAISVVVYSHDPWMVGPAVAGAWVGTFLAVKSEE